MVQLIVEVLFLATASISGLYYRIMSDAAHNRTVDGTRTGIQQRVKLECEREQQEQLLLSVIPAYIAAEVSIFSRCCKFPLFFILTKRISHRGIRLFVSVFLLLLHFYREAI